MTTYYQSVVLSECHDCGEKKECTRFTADDREAETGYVDEFDVCGECLAERGEQ